MNTKVNQIVNTQDQVKYAVRAAATYRLALDHVRIGGNLDRLVEPDAEFLEEVARERVAVGQLNDARVDVQLSANVQVVCAVEQMILRCRLRDAMTTRDRTWKRKR